MSADTVNIKCTGFKFYRACQHHFIATAKTRPTEWETCSDTTSWLEAEGGPEQPMLPPQPTAASGSCMRRGHVEFVKCPLHARHWAGEEQCSSFLNPLLWQATGPLYANFLQTWSENLAYAGSFPRHWIESKPRTKFFFSWNSNL